MNLIIKNCNSIDEANIQIEPERLNIKYGINGTGKSTIAKAIDLNTQGKEKLISLTPFKHSGKQDTNLLPSIEGADSITKVSIFNEDYINQIVFRPDEVITNSFDIFIKNETYKQKTEEIEKLISSIKDTFKGNTELEQVIKDLNDMSDSFGASKTGYSAAGSIAKGFGKQGNKIENIPAGLQGYSEFLKSPQNVKWIKWQIDGNEFIEISENCPYCTTTTEGKKDNIKLVAKEYDHKSIEHLNKVLSIVERLSKYFSENTYHRLQEITKNKTELAEEEKNYLIEIKNQIDVLRGKLNELRGITFFTFREDEKVIDKVNFLKINIGLLSHLESEETKKIVDSINDSLETVSKLAGELQGQVNQQKIGIQKTILEYKTEINNFLRFAGYKYNVDIENDSNEYKMKLKHEDFNENVTSGTQHLSFGEKNAFALVLFMYQSLSANPDLIILDDPISSFDRNKKFAIIEKLFRGKKSFRGKTVLMMTHDLEPIIDLVKNLPHEFQPVPVASFLEAKKGIVKEIKVTKDDVITFGQVCHENIGSECDDVIKLIYLRRFHEIVNDKGNIYQLIANLLHKREKPFKRVDLIEVEMTSAEIDEVASRIKIKIPTFDYQVILNKLNDAAQMRTLYDSAPNNYEKLQLFRIINGQHENDVIAKYINETFHIENEYVMQLNPNKYEGVPEFIIDECSKSLQAIEA
ncbi:hypothetical protein A7981_06540 [Methylovorus sp. MM2]|uniref:AAA family ATPase n=1 Tax=Methylovorus sp. MM2 TaxID=1848038 RepID=UPI0007E1BEDC|nr:AAA family ATPase [Methylovorus sp. MM2]OAM53074.1 hypothetical protein A7981_06540 [Methylovorus sp. MM2]